MASNEGGGLFSLFLEKGGEPFCGRKLRVLCLQLQFSLWRGMRSSTGSDREVLKWGLRVLETCTGFVLTDVENEEES